MNGSIRIALVGDKELHEWFNHDHISMRQGNACKVRLGTPRWVVRHCLIAYRIFKESSLVKVETFYFIDEVPY